MQPARRACENNGCAHQLWLANTHTAMAGTCACAAGVQQDRLGSGSMRVPRLVEKSPQPNKRGPGHARSSVGAAVSALREQKAANAVRRPVGLGIQLGCLLQNLGRAQRRWHGSGLSLALTAKLAHEACELMSHGVLLLVGQERNAQVLNSFACGYETAAQNMPIFQCYISTAGSLPSRMAGVCKT